LVEARGEIEVGCAHGQILHGHGVRIVVSVALSELGRVALAAGVDALSFCSTRVASTTITRHTRVRQDKQDNRIGGELILIN
jgi:hypothetical protein